MEVVQISRTLLVEKKAPHKNSSRDITEMVETAKLAALLKKQDYEEILR